MDRDGERLNLHSELTDGKKTGGDKREDHRSIFQCHAIRDEVRDPRRETVVTTQSSVVGRRSGEFYT
jgi:hypothetical protein